MSVIESILKDLQGLSTPKLVEVARYVHDLSETAQKERLSLLHQTHGTLSEEDGKAFELALTPSHPLHHFPVQSPPPAAKRALHVPFLE